MNCAGCEILEHIDMLGKKVRDKVTGYMGIATSLSFDLHGCIQIIINPGIGKDGRLMELNWFDIKRIELVNSKKVMDPPDFRKGTIAKGDKGPAEKPICGKN